MYYYYRSIVKEGQGKNVSLSFSLSLFLKNTEAPFFIPNIVQCKKKKDKEKGAAYLPLSFAN